MKEKIKNAEIAKLLFLTVLAIIVLSKYKQEIVPVLQGG